MIQMNINNFMKIKKHIHITFNTAAEITQLYRSLKIDYPKFFKMDGLSKLGFLVSEIIFKDMEERFIPREDVAIISFNRSSSLNIDTQYQETINNNAHYFPSPSLFVYTLPNIANAEITIRNKFFGETFFYLCKLFDAKQIIDIVDNTFQDQTIIAALVSWIECFEDKREVLMLWIEKDNSNMELTKEQLEKLYNS